MQAGKIRRAMGLVLLGITLAPACTAVRAAVVGVAWDPPADVNGTPLTDLAGFRVCYGTQSGNYTATMDVGMNRTALLESLDPGTTYYIAVKAYSVSGVESDASDELVWVFDGDSDDMPDSWEIDHFGDVSGELTGKNADYDGDGMVNGNEYVAGTDPADPEDFASIAIVMKSGQPFASFMTLPASGSGYTGMTRFYSLEQSVNLASGAWEVVPGCEAIQATGGLVEVPVGGSGTAPMFFRTRITLN